MIKLIGKDITGRTIIVEAEDEKAVAKYRRIYAKIGVHLESYDKAVKREAKRLVDQSDEPPQYQF